MVRVTIFGAAGRMGRRLVALTAEDPMLELAGAVVSEGHGDAGRSVGAVCGMPTLESVVFEESLGAGGDVVIDFSSPQGTRRALADCQRLGLPLVIGTTGLLGEDHEEIDRAAKSIAVLQAPNMSLGVNLLLGLVGRVAQQLKGYDIEIAEAHHRFKKDAPSGTAMGIVEAICKATGRDVKRDVVFGRWGECPRQPGQIGVHALRMGDVVGEHTVTFAELGERFELRHTATDRDIFARGALRAAKWLVGQAAGRYTMADVLGLGAGTASG